VPDDAVKTRAERPHHLPEIAQNLGLVVDKTPALAVPTEHAFHKPLPAALINKANAQQPPGVAVERAAMIVARVRRPRHSRIVGCRHNTSLRDIQ
jgi:hypothetical protein